MKKLLLLSVLLTLSITAISQTKAPKALGITIEGSKTRFNKHLLDNGYKYCRDNVYKGSFLNKECYIKGHFTSSSKELYSITIIYNVENNWKSVEDKMEELKDIFSKKYTLFVDNKYYKESNNHKSEDSWLKYNSLKDGSYIYNYGFTGDNLYIDIKVSITNNNTFISIEYFNLELYKKIQKEKLDSI